MDALLSLPRSLALETVADAMPPHSISGGIGKSTDSIFAAGVGSRTLAPVHSDSPPKFAVAGSVHDFRATDHPTRPAENELPAEAREKTGSDFAPVSEWTDARLVAAIRGEEPDSRALDELAQRYWKPLFGRCHMLALNRDEASDLAQEAWCRVLKSRSTLKPEGNFPGYLNTIAMNVWRDRCRSSRRAGAMAGNRLISLDAGLGDRDGDTLTLAEAVPDLAALEGEAQAMLMLDVDCALERLTPLLRGVLVARFLLGESCAEIGRRHARTEQTISGWVRQGVEEVKLHLRESRGENFKKNS